MTYEEHAAKAMSMAMDRVLGAPRLHELAEERDALKQILEDVKATLLNKDHSHSARVVVALRRIEQAEPSQMTEQDKRLDWAERQADE